MRKKIFEKLKNYRIKIMVSIFIITIIAFIVMMIRAYLPYMNLNNVTKDELDELSLDGFDKLMIVAHPDDELLWGGAHLIEDDYFVVCITSGNNDVRSKEFLDIMNATKDKGIILDYPDKIAEKRSNWKWWKKDIMVDIETILSYKDWELVVTHNEDGEYGHSHHMMTHEYVNDAYDNVECKSEQYYFGEYFIVDEIPNELDRVDTQVYYEKRDIGRLYKSQRGTLRKLYHMMPHENWIHK